MAQFLSFDCKLTLSVYKLFFLMPNVDFINQKDFKDTIIIKGEKPNPDLTTQMLHFFHFLLAKKATKYGLDDPRNLEAFYEFETSLLVYRHIGFCKEDLMEIIESQLHVGNHSRDEDSIYSSLLPYLRSNREGRRRDRPQTLSNHHVSAIPAPAFHR